MSEIEHLVMPALRAAGRPTTYENQERMRKALTEAANARAEAVGVPVGWYLVPEVPTEDQMQAGLYQASHDAEYADVCQSYMDMVRTPVDAPALAHPAVPEGYVLVPRIPTGEMLDATNWSDTCSMSVWSTMIAAAEKEAR